MEDIHEKNYYHLRLTPDAIPDMEGVIWEGHHFSPYLKWIGKISPDEHLAVVEILNDDKEYHPHIHSIIYVSKHQITKIRNHIRQKFGFKGKAKKGGKNQYSLTMMNSTFDKLTRYLLKDTVLCDGSGTVMKTNTTPFNDENILRISNLPASAKYDKKDFPKYLQTWLDSPEATDVPYARLFIEKLDSFYLSHRRQLRRYKMLSLCYDKGFITHAQFLAERGLTLQDTMYGD